MTTSDDLHANQEHPASKAEAAPGVIPPPPPLSPHLTVRGGQAAIAFYERAFGARVLFRNDTAGGKILHASLVLPNGGVFMLHDDFLENHDASKAPEALGGTPVTLNVDLPDVDAVWKSALDAGAEQVFPLKDQFWGDRYGVLQDPFGHRWGLSTRKQVVSREQLEEASRNVDVG